MNYSGKSQSLKAIGELDLIERLRHYLRGKSRKILIGIGDDACVLKDGTVISIDSFVDSVHFDLSYFDHRTLGRRLMAAALSDLAAMAATPVTNLVSIMCPAKIKTKELSDFYHGLHEMARAFDCPIAGGDTDSSKEFAVSIVVIGKVAKPILRSAARHGDFLYITGYPGLSEAGRLVLKNNFFRAGFKTAIKKHVAPVPRIKEALVIKKFARAMIDTSDGLSTDAFHLARESKVKIIINRNDIPIHPEIQKLSSRLGFNPMKFVLASGEDFELLFTSSKNLPSKIGQLKITKIGYVNRGRGLFIKAGNKITRIKASGFEHFVTRLKI